MTTYKSHLDGESVLEDMLTGQQDGCTSEIECRHTYLTWMENHPWQPAGRLTDQQAERGASKAEEEEEVPTRGKWGKSIQSLLLCISMSVGLGNVWRFPNVAYNNGGGAFLIPYLLLLVIIGRPLYYLELILGQFSSQGPIKLWRVVQHLKVLDMLKYYLCLLWLYFTIT
ncbi:sodium-dependent nutrient amino acid transporter 1 [Caerostris extrusa]|uniref:Sodium-dependent nutrient amino acid transporter 1 n=1 Tax=Caerostris extrusa TaxID=172846 RepID=A0AAV4TIU7_CAEEX|nr:sodium-dependent nutrient amino acid transporter 1 [Caerostris extrusa]